MNALPTVTVVVPTRNNLQELMRDLVPSLFAEKAREQTRAGSQNPPSAWVQTVLVDQSPGNETRDALGEAGVLDDPSVTYVWTPEQRGISRARNIGVRRAEGDIVAFLDSDIIVSPGHITAIARAFRDCPDIDAMFGPVLIHAPTWHRYGEGTIPSFEPTERRVVRPSDVDEGCGMGANFAIRRDVALRFPYDEFLGAGTEFPSCEEVDQVARMKQLGHSYGVFTEPVVYHTGIRLKDEVKRWVRDTEHARGAMHAKQARLSNLAPLAIGVTGIVEMAWNNMKRTGWPQGLTRLGAYSRGFCEALLHYGVNSSQQVFTGRKSTERARLPRSVTDVS